MNGDGLVIISICCVCIIVVILVSSPRGCERLKEYGTCIVSYELGLYRNVLELDVEIGVEPPDPPSVIFWLKWKKGMQLLVYSGFRFWQINSTGMSLSGL